MARGRPFEAEPDPRRGPGRPFCRGCDPRRHRLTDEERSRGGRVALIRFARRWRADLGIDFPPLWEDV